MASKLYEISKSEAATNTLTNVFNDNQSTVLTMSSREIAKLTAKRHDNVLRDIEVIKEQFREEQEANPENSNLSFLAISSTYSVGDQIRTYPEYLLPRRETEILITGYDVMRRAAVIDRWFQLESASRLPNFNDPIEAAKAWIKVAEEKRLITQERDEAIKTKAHINNRKTATAMATASAYSKQNKRLVIENESLKDEIGNGKNYQTLLIAGLPQRMQIGDKKKDVPTYLKKISAAMGYPMGEVYVPYYERPVKTYHVEVIKEFKRAYIAGEL